MSAGAFPNFQQRCLLTRIILVTIGGNQILYRRIKICIITDSNIVFFCSFGSKNASGFYSWKGIITHDDALMSSQNQLSSKYYARPAMFVVGARFRSNFEAHNGVESLFLSYGRCTGKSSRKGLPVFFGASSIDLIMSNNCSLYISTQMAL